MKILLLILLPVFCQSQNIGSIVSQFIGGASDGLNQRILHKKFGQGNQFWDYKISWQNKYKDWPHDKSEAFPLSKTVLVAFTDGYHLTRFISNQANNISLFINIMDIKDKKIDIKYIIKTVILNFAANRAGFIMTYYIKY